MESLGDLIQSSGNSFIVTLVERHSRCVMLAKVPSNKKQVIEALIKQAGELPAELYKLLTCDRGGEFTNHKDFTLTTGIKPITVIHNHLDNEVLMKIKIGYSDNISQKELT